MSKSYYQCLLFKQFTTLSKTFLFRFRMSKSYYQCLLFKQFTTPFLLPLYKNMMSKSYYQCLLFKQFTTSEVKILSAEQMSKSYYQCYFSVFILFQLLFVIPFSRCKDMNNLGITQKKLCRNTDGGAMEHLRFFGGTLLYPQGNVKLPQSQYRDAIGLEVSISC